MARERSVVDQDHVIADLAIVRHVSAGEKEAVAADARDMPPAFRAAIHGHMLASGGVWAYDQPAFLAPVFLILGRTAEHCEGMNFASLADFGIAGDDGVRMYFDSITEGDIRADDRKRADFDPCPKFRVRVNCR